MLFYYFCSGTISSCDSQSYFYYRSFFSQRKEENLQWERIGISHKQTVTIRSVQAITYAVIMLISTVFFNIIFFVLMHKEALLLGIKKMNFGTIIYYPIIISIVMYLFVLLPKVGLMLKIKQIDK